MNDYMRRLVNWYNGGSAEGLGGSTAIACNLTDPKEQNKPVNWKDAGGTARKSSPYFHQGINQDIESVQRLLMVHL